MAIVRRLPRDGPTACPQRSTRASTPNRCGTRALPRVPPVRPRRLGAIGLRSRREKPPGTANVHLFCPGGSRRRCIVPGEAQRRRWSWRLPVLSMVPAPTTPGWSSSLGPGGFVGRRSGVRWSGSWTCAGSGHPPTWLPRRRCPRRSRTWRWGATPALRCGGGVRASVPLPGARSTIPGAPGGAPLLRACDESTANSCGERRDARTGAPHWARRRRARDDER